MSVEELLPQQRHRLILERLLAQGRVIAVDLARELEVSHDTIRRDLREMAAAGQCRRVYGGALPLAPDRGTLVQRQAQAPGRKAALARAAIGLIERGQVLFLDAGSTNIAIAQALPADYGLTVATNAPAIAALLAPREDLQLIAIGGRIEPRIGAALGAGALREVEAIRSDWYFLGVCGADHEAGISARDYEDAQFKQAAAQAARAVAVLVTDDKFGTAAPYTVLAADAVAALVIEHDGDAAQARAFAAKGARVVRAGPAQ
ncbi:transcriptional regulator, DeoR family [Lysobacter enzymogenes]|uniref:Transcriptional regulator, DeoR family n=1 Tax=Lysobacter enzymogenes TaxID=69 RepID=A0A0S2DJA2_LYSEN|nr:DeoR/GlpR family DNA-binding transcription regulator [Lysobacter enzymogenes]ALN58477.1 transcriptional regulator, DeoR family [Lysobacter enzymogenes]